MATLDRKTVLSVLNIGARLLVICLAVAALVSLVNEVTKERYAQIQKEEQRMAIAGIFNVEQPDYTELGDGVYLVTDGDVRLGVCVQTVTAGFGGDMTLMVGFDNNGAIIGVQILTHSETPGLGAKVNDGAYLSQYEGQNGNLTLGQDVDAVSGATISSRAVLDGVNRARDQFNRYVSSEDPTGGGNS